jgi:hypothetical protein
MDQAKTMASKLVDYKVDTVHWRHILNNATTTRPQKCGGPTCSPIEGLLQYHGISDLKKDTTPFVEPMPVLPTWSDDFTIHLQECPDAWTCAILNMPNSFTMGDQHGLKVAAAATKKPAAVQKVCLLAFSILLLHGPKRVLLRQNHWKVPVETIQEDAKAIFGEQSPASGSDVNLAPAPLPRSRNAKGYYEAPLPDQMMERKAKICEILTQIIHESASGWVDPRHTKNWWLLRQYVIPGGLKAFIQQNEQFEIWHHTDKVWFFGFARSDVCGQDADRSCSN